MSESAVSTVRQLVRDVDPTQPVYQFRTLEQALADSIAPRRFNMLLLGAFAVSALTMAAAGIFGVVGRSVARRTREAGIRIALGAPPRAVVFMVASQAMAYGGAGIVAGIIAALGVSQTMRGLLHDLDPNDPAVFAAVAGIVSITALVACWIPAARAARVDPVVALRQE